MSLLTNCVSSRILSVYIYKLKSHITFFLFLSCKIIAKKTSCINIVKCKHVFIFSHCYAFSVLLILSFKISYELKNKFISLERREYENLVNFMIPTVNNTQDLTHFARLIQRDFFYFRFFSPPFHTNIQTNFKYDIKSKYFLHCTLWHM